MPAIARICCTQPERGIETRFREVVASEEFSAAIAPKSLLPPIWPPRRKFHPDEADLPDYADFSFCYFLVRLRLATDASRAAVNKNALPARRSRVASRSDPRNPEIRLIRMKLPSR